MVVGYTRDVLIFIFIHISKSIIHIIIAGVGAVFKTLGGVAIRRFRNTHQLVGNIVVFIIIKNIINRNWVAKIVDAVAHQVREFLLPFEVCYLFRRFRNYKKYHQSELGFSIKKPINFIEKLINK